MDIDLYFIKGISMQDTYMFTGTQSDYLATFKKYTISTSYYPPYYRNSIKIDTSEISFDSNINYLSFEYNNLTYYYFIDSIEYVSETVIILNIVMDTIQTYFFTYNLSGNLTRKMIKPYKDKKINREYIRENVSEGEMKLADSRALTSISGYIVVTTSQLSNILVGGDKIIDATVSTNTGKPYISVYGRKEKLPYYIYFLPYFESNTIVDNKRNVTYTMNTTVSSSNLRSYISRDNYKLVEELLSNQSVVLVQPVHCDFDFISYENNITTFKNVAGISLDFYVYENRSSTSEGLIYRSGVPIVTFSNQATIQYTYEYYYDLQDVLSDYVSKVDEYPCLYDENYIRVSVGEKLGSTSAPLSQFYSMDFRFVAICQGFTGYNGRVYGLEDDETYIASTNYDEIDKFNSYISVNTNESMPLFTDYSRDFMQNNFGSLVGVGLALTNTALGGMFSTTTSHTVSKGFETVVKGVTKGGGQPFAVPSRLSKVKAPYERVTNRESTESPYGIISGASQDIMGYGVGALNAMFTPDKERQGSNYYTTIRTRNMLPKLETYIVYDFERCYNYYKYFGNKVNDFVNNASITTFYLGGYMPYDKWNFLQGDFYVTPTDDAPLLSVEVLDDIHERYAKGIRFWQQGTTIMEGGTNNER